jgi:hypothetical protein
MRKENPDLMNSIDGFPHNLIQSGSIEVCGETEKTGLIENTSNDKLSGIDMAAERFQGYGHRVPYFGAQQSRGDR